MLRSVLRTCRIRRLPGAPAPVRRALMVAAVVLLAPAAAGADASGPACVEDGDTLVIDGRRAYGRCEGGTPVELYGIDAPELKQTCGREDETWACGRQAAAVLLYLTQNKTVTCAGNSYDRHDRLVGICRAGGVELNAMMVRSGLALSSIPRYAAAEKEARARGAGVWSGPFQRPEVWRRTH